MVVHQYIDITEEYQKKGIATNVNKALYYSYKESNTEEIRLTAEKSGSYVWAKQGFYNRDPYNIIKYIEEDNNKSSYADTYRKAVDDFYKKHKKRTIPNEGSYKTTNGKPYFVWYSL
ncbi:MAG: hypothetical protein K6G31_04505 [Paludibacteraceae bacterium]|nr:hypothetical protein [Paludibacteraceae bacterium]